MGIVAVTRGRDLVHPEEGEAAPDVVIAGDAAAKRRRQGEEMESLESSSQLVRDRFAPTNGGGRRAGRARGLSVIVGCGSGRDQSDRSRRARPTTARPSRLSQGQELRVRLEGNPTTGFTWEAQDLPAVLEQKGEPVYVSGGTAVGSGGTYTFTFAGKQAGDGQLTLIYHRTFEVRGAAGADVHLAGDGEVGPGRGRGTRPSARSGNRRPAGRPNDRTSALQELLERTQVEVVPAGGEVGALVVGDAGVRQCESGRFAGGFEDEGRDRG